MPVPYDFPWGETHRHLVMIPPESTLTSQGVPYWVTHGGLFNGSRNNSKAQLKGNCITKANPSLGNDWRKLHPWNFLHNVWAAQHVRESSPVCCSWLYNPEEEPCQSSKFHLSQVSWVSLLPPRGNFSTGKKLLYNPLELLHSFYPLFSDVPWALEGWYRCPIIFLHLRLSVNIL